MNLRIGQSFSCPFYNVFEKSLWKEIFPQGCPPEGCHSESLAVSREILFSYMQIDVAKVHSAVLLLSKN